MVNSDYIKNTNCMVNNDIKLNMQMQKLGLHQLVDRSNIKR